MLQSEVDGRLEVAELGAAVVAPALERIGEYALVGSQGGAPKDPSWVLNVRAAPDEAAIQDGPEPFDVTIRELDGEGGAGR